MKIIFFLFYLFFSTSFVIGQKTYNQIGVNFYVQRDWYPEFSYSINPTNSYFAKIRGTSWGGDANYKFKVRSKLFLKVGAGFYRYAFNKIEGKNTLVASSTFATRIIDFPSPLYVIFSTDKYWV